MTAIVPNIITAMDHPDLFGPMFAGPSWAHWKIVIRGAFALPMSEAEREFFRTVTGREPPGHRVRELDIIAGRRSGKDSIASMIACYAAVTFRPNGKVRPGERPLVMLIAADRSQARSLLNYVKGYLSEIAPLRTLVQRETMDGLELSNVDITVQTCDFRSARGRTVLLAIFNETAFWSSENSSSPDTEVFRAVQPSLATLGDESMLIMISSAYKRSGLLYDRWKKFYGTDDPNTLIVHAKTADLNPTISQATIGAALADDPEAAKAEWLSQWRDDLASYITRPEVENCIDRGVTVRSPQQGTQYTAFVDASSGAGKDSMCAAIGHREGNDICVIDAMIEIRPPFAPPDAVAQIATTLKTYGITRAGADKWGLGFVATEFERHGISLDYSDKASSEIFRQALPIIRSHRARLIDNDRLVNQFTNLERRIMPSGGERIGHPERGGHHDDVAVVVAGCLVALATPLSGPAGWLAYYKALSEGRRIDGSIDSIHTDYDPVRPPAFGFDFSSGPPLLFRVYLPEVLVPGSTGVRWSEGMPYVEVTRDEAEEYMRRAPIAELNPDLARELGIKEATP